MSKFPEFNLNIPYITPKIKGIGGLIKQKPEHFVVEEIPLYDPLGTGKHLYVNITKENQTTREVQLQLARMFELKPENIGKAGLKDKYARTTQTFSVLLENDDSPTGELKELIQSNIESEVNWVKYHNNKLRSGHLIGNKFSIKITELDKAPINAMNSVKQIIDKIHQTGLPNYYGIQRIGKDGNNVRSGWELISGTKRIRDRWLKKYLISSYQSYLANRYLATRVNKGLFDNLILGDIAKKHDTGGLFWVEDVETEQRRFDDKEISFTAPIYGYKMKFAKDDAKLFEDRVLEESTITLDQMKRNKMKGTRRLGRILPDISCREVADGIVLKFSLPKGAFATTVLREFLKND